MGYDIPNDHHESLPDAAAKAKQALIQSALDECNRMDRCAGNIRRLCTDFELGRVDAGEFEAQRNRYVFERDQPGRA